MLLTPEQIREYPTTDTITAARELFAKSDSMIFDFSDGADAFEPEDERMVASVMVARTSDDVILGQFHAHGEIDDPVVLRTTMARAYSTDYLGSVDTRVLTSIMPGGPAGIHTGLVSAFLAEALKARDHRGIAAHMLFQNHESGEFRFAYGLNREVARTLGLYFLDEGNEYGAAYKSLGAMVLRPDASAYFEAADLSTRPDYSDDQAIWHGKALAPLLRVMLSPNPVQVAEQYGVVRVPKTDS